MSLVWYYCSECACTNWGQKWGHKEQLLEGTGACIQSSPEVPHENLLRYFNTKVGRYFQTNNWELEFTWN